MQIRFGDAPYIDPVLLQAQREAQVAGKGLTQAKINAQNTPTSYNFPRWNVTGSDDFKSAVNHSIKIMREDFKPVAQGVVQGQNTQNQMLETMAAQQRAINGILTHLTSDEQGF